MTEAPEPRPADIKDQLAGLTATAGALVGTMTDTLGKVERRYRRSTAVLWSLGAGLVVLALLAVTQGFVIYNQVGLIDRIQANARSIQAVQERTSNQVLCPLYKLFVDSLTPARRARQAPETLVAYDLAVSVFKSGYATLDCPVTPPTG